MRCAVIANDDHRENLIYVHIIMRETDYSTILATNIPAIGHLLAFEINKVYLVCGPGERRWKIAHKQPSRGADVRFRGWRFEYYTHTLLNAPSTHAGVG